MKRTAIWSLVATTALSAVPGNAQIQQKQLPKKAIQSSPQKELFFDRIGVFVSFARGGFQYGDPKGMGVIAGDLRASDKGREFNFQDGKYKINFPYRESLVAKGISPPIIDEIRRNGVVQAITKLKVGHFILGFRKEECVVIPVNMGKPAFTLSKKNKAKILSFPLGNMEFEFQGSFGVTIKAFPRSPDILFYPDNSQNGGVRFLPLPNSRPSFPVRPFPNSKPPALQA